MGEVLRQQMTWRRVGAQGGAEGEAVSAVGAVGRAGWNVVGGCQVGGG